MPQPTFALSRPPTLSPVFGLPLATPPILPTYLIQAATNTASATTIVVTLGAAPKTGSILVANVCVNTSNASSSAISGGGVSVWNRILLLAAGTATASSAWWGVVGGSPATTITMQVNSSANTASANVAEFGNLVGTSLSTGSNSRNGSGSVVLPDLRSSRSRGIVILTYGGQGAITLPSGYATATSTSTNRVTGILYGAAAYPANTTLSVAFNTTSTLNACGVILA